MAKKNILKGIMDACSNAFFLNVDEPRRDSAAADLSDKGIAEYFETEFAKLAGTVNLHE